MLIDYFKLELKKKKLVERVCIVYFLILGKGNKGILIVDLVFSKKYGMN